MPSQISEAQSQILHDQIVPDFLAMLDEAPALQDPAEVEHLAAHLLVPLEQPEIPPEVGFAVVEAISARRDAAAAGVLAALAGVDRSYIYDHPDLLEEIRGQRSTTPSKLTSRPIAERSTNASLQARLRSAHEEITGLKVENRKLRERLAIALGDAWQADIELPRSAGEARG